MNRLYINKIYDTSADTLLLLGAAELVRLVLKCLEKPHRGIVLHNQGDSQSITFPCALRREELQSEKSIFLLGPLITAKQDEKQAKKGRTLQDGFDYEAEQAKQKTLSLQLKALPVSLRTPEARLRKEPDLEKVLAQGPRPELAQYMAINVMKVADTFNEIVLRWNSLTTTQQWQVIVQLYDLFSERANNLPLAIQRWNTFAKEEHIVGKALVTAVQAINPTTGKGSNLPKGYRLSNGGLDSFWLLELLKFKGFMVGSAPYVMKGSKDRKTYVVVPQVVELGTLNSIMQDFRAICWSSTAVKQDILAALRLTQVLVKHRRTEITTQQQEDDQQDEQPLISIVQGFAVTSYKDMGSAHATMNVATINIPSWFPRLSTLQAVDEAELFLQEHLRIIRRIEGYQGKEYSEEVTLLHSYRDFLSGHDLRSFWLFAARYGSYLFRQREHEKDVKRWLPQLTLKGMEYLVLQQQQNQPSLRTITEKAGFRSIATAIREATIRTQRRRSQDNDTKYEVRYGLEQELMRKARRRDDFLIALNQFLVSYNVETAREEEKVARRLQRRLTKQDYNNYKLRYPVSTRDISEVEELLDLYPTELIASMLLAHGYARYEALNPDEIRNDTPDTIDEQEQEQDNDAETSDEEA
ncbi:hypothetical protein [Dictyobacter arantiisoli]|uniref:Type I-B CRISPR-associated protein Cas8b1/Cst1 n=1 Tax=Dictyobacter arantiisoli TaxID=2014874 RepID=A0A5A5TI32_9CHLR|nr:hypothetical protein [Dictyobacter arantiisoli]GCF11250.1 hypothetical protein KDI_48140 [Dictyobacter arantiisoli]